MVGFLHPPPSVHVFAYKKGKILASPPLSDFTELLNCLGATPPVYKNVWSIRFLRCTPPHPQKGGRSLWMTPFLCNNCSTYYTERGKQKILHRYFTGYCGRSNIHWFIHTSHTFCRWVGRGEETQFFHFILVCGGEKYVLCAWPPTSKSIPALLIVDPHWLNTPDAFENVKWISDYISSKYWKRRVWHFRTRNLHCLLLGWLCDIQLMVADEEYCAYAQCDDSQGFTVRFCREREGRFLNFWQPHFWFMLP